MKKTRVCPRKSKFIISLILTVTVIMSLWPLACLAEEEADEKRIMVSLGDSYSSGEGIPPFYGQDDQRQEKVNNPDWLAHRSQKAWSGMLSLPHVSGKMSDHKDDNWFFAAASGAETKHLLNEFHKDAKKGLVYTDSTDPELSLEPQLNVFDRIGKNKADYVTVTLGGNDADFVGIITKCILRGSDRTISNYLSPGELSDQLNHTWEYFFEKEGIRDNLYKAYHDIANRAGSQAQIIVAGYPQLLNPEGGFMISSNEANLVNSNVTKFNKAIESVVNQCRDEGLQISFVSVEEEFKGHAAYSKDSYINEVMYYLNDEDLTDFAMPPVSAFSIHPNEKGARTYANCVQQKIDELESIANGVLNNEFTLSVFDANDKLYNNYLIKIDGEEYVGLLKWGILRKEYSRIIEVDKADKVSISLPKGNYKFTIIDSSDDSSKYYRNIKIRPGIKNDSLEFRTIFGEHQKAKTAEDDKSSDDSISSDIEAKMTDPILAFTMYKHFSLQHNKSLAKDSALFWGLVARYATIKAFKEDGTNKGRLAELYEGDKKGDTVRISDSAVDDLVNAVLPELTEYPDLPEAEYETYKHESGYYFLPVIDMDTFGCRIKSFVIHENGQVEVIAEVFSYMDDQPYASYKLLLQKNLKVNNKSIESYEYCIMHAEQIDESTKSDKDIKRKSTDKEVNNPSDSYIGIIDKYQEALTNRDNDYELESLQSKYPHLNCNLIYDAYLNEYGLSYWLYDIDKNGSEELFISSDFGNEEIDGYFYALYAQGDDQAIPLITDCVYRIIFYVCEDGSIIKYGSTSATTGQATVYKMNAVGDGLVLNDEYEIDYENYPDAPYSNGEVRMTKEEFDMKYKMVDPSAFIMQEN